MTITRLRSLPLLFGYLLFGQLLLKSGAALAQGIDSAGWRPLEVTVTRPNIEDGTLGFAATVIDAAKIAQSPAVSLPALLAQEPGVQFRDLFGGQGVRATIDLRGFGATATQNAVILLNGRRLNDFDNAGVEFANIPRENIRRIEILRGNSAAVLYGDGAVGGAVNIITRPGAPTNGAQANSASVAGAAGSFGLRESRVSVARSSRDYNLSFDGNGTWASGWRDNNGLEQKGASLEVRRLLASGQGGVWGHREWYATLAADAQHLGLPGARRVNLTTGLDQVHNDPTGATTPTDFVDQTGLRSAFGVARVLPGGAELGIDGGIRTKAQDSIVISPFGNAFSTVTNTRLATYSFTPKVRWNGGALGGVAGLDYIYSDYNQVARQGVGNTPVHRYDLKQHSLAVYGLAEKRVTAADEMSAGLRLQNIRFIGGDELDPKYVTTFLGVPFDGHRASARIDDGEWAGHLGVDHRLSRDAAVFGRLGRSFRMPTVDERVLSSATYDSFGLRVQTSWDAETGVRWQAAGASLRVSLYVMHLKDEIAFDAGTFLTQNIDQTRRWGVEAGADVPLAPSLSLAVGAAWTRAVFRAGANDGNDVPLVSKWTGSATLRWAFAPDWTFASTLTAVGPRRMENDDANEGQPIAGHGLVDVKVATKQGAWTFAAQANNLFDREYFNYAVRSASNPRIYNAYPLPGRTWKVEAGLKF